MAIRIVLLDDQPIVLRGIEQLFESQPDISVIGRTRIPADALKLVETELPDVLVFELPTPRSRAIALLRALRRVPRTHLLLLTGVRELEALVDAVHHGVAGVVTKDMRPEDLVAALQQYEAYWEKGMFASQHSACKLRQEFTLGRLADHFSIDDGE